jgi:hypothetical protein
VLKFSDMESENSTVGVNVEEHKSPLHCVTPLSKYLAMVLFILMPFIGGWIGYTYAPEKVVEVDRVIVNNSDEGLISDIEIVSEPDETIKRILLTRKDIFNDRDGWNERFNIPFDKALSSIQNETTKATFQIYQGNGISLLVPYNEGMGYPYYRLPPYEQINDMIFFDGEGGGVIKLHPVDSLESIVTKIESDNGSTCEPFIVNAGVKGEKCQILSIDSRDDLSELFIQGKEYVYGFTFYSISDDERAVMYKSIIVN